MKNSKMDIKKVENLCKTLIERRIWPYTTKDIEELWNPVKEDLTSEEQILLLNCLANKDSIFKWLALISNVLPSLDAEDPEFINLLGIVIDRVKDDLAQGPFIRSLIEIGERDPDKGIRLYAQLTTVSNDAVIHYSGLVLGGAAKKKFEEAFKVIKEDLKKDKVSVKVACIKALRVAYENGGAVQFKPEILDILESLLNIRDYYLKADVIRSYIDFDKFNTSEKCAEKLLEIATTGDSSARVTLLGGLLFTSLRNQSKEVEILRLCSEDNDTNVLGNLVAVLSRKGQKFLNDSLEMIKSLLKKPVYVRLPYLGYYIKELCKDNPELCERTIERWIELDSNPLFRFRASNILSEIGTAK